MKNNPLDLNTMIQNQPTQKDNNNQKLNSAVKNDQQELNNVKLKKFKYKAKTQDGNEIEDEIDAENKLEVESLLLNKGYTITSIEEVKLSISFRRKAKKMSAKKLNFFLTQLSTYVKAGIPLLDSMEKISNQTSNSKDKSAYNRIVLNLNKGLSFSQCLEKEGTKFPKMLINMLKTSEMTGDLTGVLDDMAAYYKRKDSNQKQIINAMTYPSVLLIFALAVLTFVIVYVVPSFTSMYESTGSDLPGITVAVMNVSDFVTTNWITIVISLAVVILTMAFLYKNVKSVKYSMQSFVMHIPVVKSIVEYNQLVIFTSTFSTLIKHDVFITDSMEILNQITDNEVYRKIIQNAISNLSLGNGISVAFKDHWAFPQTAYEMLVTGEKTGKLGEMMSHVAEYYQEEQTNIVNRLKSLVEPIMIILLAGIVGVILLAVVVPMFDIYSTIT